MYNYVVKIKKGMEKSEISKEIIKNNTSFFRHIYRYGRHRSSFIKNR